MSNFIFPQFLYNKDKSPCYIPDLNIKIPKKTAVDVLNLNKRLDASVVLKSHGGGDLKRALESGKVVVLTKMPEEAPSPGFSVYNKPIPSLLNVVRLEDMLKKNYIDKLNEEFMGDVKNMSEEDISRQTDKFINTVDWTEDADEEKPSKTKK